MDDLAAKVLAVVRRIPSGRVLTYGDVAGLAEVDATARDVGQVLLRHGEAMTSPGGGSCASTARPRPTCSTASSACSAPRAPRSPPPAPPSTSTLARWAASGLGQDAQPSLFD